MRGGFAHSGGSLGQPPTFDRGICDGEISCTQGLDGLVVLQGTEPGQLFRAELMGAFLLVRPAARQLAGALLTAGHCLRKLSSADLDIPGTCRRTGCRYT